MESVIGVRHLVLAEGVKLISNTTNPEITLKGVKDEVIIHIFGPEIYEAITASRMRKTEVEEDNSRSTKCVSMIFKSKNELCALFNSCSCPARSNSPFEQLTTSKRFFIAVLLLIFSAHSESPTSQSTLLLFTITLDVCLVQQLCHL